ncbi:hypothetical protein [Rhodococcus sp. 11-3]|uniref:DUF7178 family protein n=1 Tax=Rhodococcus sp. 11-3 TaxID=2854796 RepID=UPI002041246B|nr:hypothetical protein [Rhodococcus sp. 11-3]USC17020.1 hypothetical protein KZJ41_09205 [Rhodococcus sp. 11-3]
MTTVATTITATIDALSAALIDATDSTTVSVDYRQGRKPVGARITVTYRPRMYGRASTPGALGWIDVSMHALEGLHRPADATFRRIANGVKIMLWPAAIESAESAETERAADRAAVAELLQAHDVAPTCQHNGTRATYTDCRGFVVAIECDDCEGSIPIVCESCYRAVSVVSNRGRCAYCDADSFRPIIGAGIGVGVSLGKPWAADYSAVTADRTLGERIGAAYVAAPEYDDRPIVRRCYAAFIAETWAQLDRILSAGIDVRVTDDDPYSDYAEMAADVRNGRLSVMSTETTGGHPFLTNDDNDAFRAVHDYYGHFLSGRDFSRHGEEAAFQRHMRMYGTAARAAMTVETRGQNSAFIWINGGGSNFPVQKFTLLPVWATYERTGMQIPEHALRIEYARSAGMMRPLGAGVGVGIVTAEQLTVAGRIMWAGIGSRDPERIGRYAMAEYVGSDATADDYRLTIGAGVGVGIATGLQATGVPARRQRPATRRVGMHNGPTVEVVGPRARESRRPADALGRVFGLSTRAVVANILAYYDAASDEQRAAGVEWYETARDHAAIISWQHSAPIENVVAVISHLSPQTAWDVNLAGAYSLYSDGTAARCMGDNIARAKRAMHARDPFATFGDDAPKTKSFYRNILGDDSYVTIDVWALRAAVGRNVEESRLGRVGAYDALAHCYRIAAARRGIAPSAMQAAVWVAIRGRAN